MSNTPVPTKKPCLWVWGLWLVGFYLTWFWLVFAEWQTAREHWPIAVAMALGSYAAGATPMGGGTVGFPILVLLFDSPASLGRDFSFVVQSIGMVSASIFILCRRQPLASSVLNGAISGTLLGLPLGIFLVAPLVPELTMKIVFAVLWGSFGVLHLLRIDEIAGHHRHAGVTAQWEFRAGVLLGLLSSLTVVPITGVGVDMLVYTALVLLCRVDLKVAIPSSVIIMAFASLYGSLLKLGTVGLQPGVYENWLAAAPVVALGAPLGVLIVGLIGRKPTLLFVAALCVGQFVWTCLEEYAALQASGVMAAIAAVGVCLLLLEWLRRWGLRLAGKGQPVTLATPAGCKRAPVP